MARKSEYQVLVGKTVIKTVSIERGEWRQNKDGAWYHTGDKVTERAGR